MTMCVSVSKILIFLNLFYLDFFFYNEEYWTLIPSVLEIAYILVAPIFTGGCYLDIKTLITCIDTNIKT